MKQATVYNILGSCILIIPLVIQVCLARKFYKLMKEEEETH